MLTNEKILVLPGFTFNCAVYKPDTYDGAKKYPLIIFGHGTGEAGNNINVLYNAGLPKVLKDGFTPPFECIIVMPQAVSYGINPAWLPTILTEINKRFLIDDSRIYLTGLSGGGWMSLGSVLNVPIDTAKKITAIVAISPATQDLDKTKFDNFLINKTPVLCIVGGADVSYKEQAQYVALEINKRVPGLAKLIIRDGIGHTGWNEVYDGTFKVDGKSVWEWMQQFSKGAAQTVPPPSTDWGFKVGDTLTLKIASLTNDTVTFERVG